MAAPKGNQFWKLRSKHGRDKLFKTPKLLMDAAEEYFTWCEDNPLQEEQIVKYKDSYEKVDVSKKRPFTLTGLCIYLGCNSDYFTDFADQINGRRKSKVEQKTDQDFSRVITYIREVIYTQKFEGAASGFFNANIIARDLGLKDQSAHEISMPSIVEAPPPPSGETLKKIKKDLEADR